MMVLERLASCRGTVVFQQNIGTNGVNEGSQALRLSDSPLLPEGGYHPYERFLSKLVHNLGSQHACPQLDSQKLVKIGDKVLFGRRISFAQTLDVGFVKSEQFHER